MSEDLSFGDALDLLRSGNKVARRNWNGKNQFLELQTPDDNSKMSVPYIYITTVESKRVPWVGSQTDLLAYDWFEVKE